MSTPIVLSKILTLHLDSWCTTESSRSTWPTPLQFSYSPRLRPVSRSCPGSCACGRPPLPGCICTFDPSSHLSALLHYPFRRHFRRIIWPHILFHDNTEGEEEVRSSDAGQGVIRPAQCAVERTCTTTSIQERHEEQATSQEGCSTTRTSTCQQGWTSTCQQQAWQEFQGLPQGSAARAWCEGHYYWKRAKALQEGREETTKEDSSLEGAATRGQVRRYCQGQIVAFDMNDAGLQQVVIESRSFLRLRSRPLSHHLRGHLTPRSLVYHK